MQAIHQISVVAKEAFLGPWTGKSIADWTPEVRQQEIDLLNSACEIEKEAIESMTAGLQLLQSAPEIQGQCTDQC